MTSPKDISSGSTFRDPDFDFEPRRSPSPSHASTSQTYINPHHSIKQALIIFLVGPPAAGKTTNALAIQSYIPNVTYLSVPDLLRILASDSSSVVNYLPRTEATGEPIVEPVTTAGLLMQAICKGVALGKTVWVVDGWPRDVGDVEAWRAVVGDEIPVRICRAVELTYSLEVCLARIVRKGDMMEERVIGRRVDRIVGRRKMMEERVIDKRAVEEKWREVGRVVERMRDMGMDVVTRDATSKMEVVRGEVQCCVKDMVDCWEPKHLWEEGEL